MPGYTRELINITNIDNPDARVPTHYRGCKTLWEGFKQTVDTMPDENFLGTRNSSKEGRPYEWKTYQEIESLSGKFARGMFKMQLINEV